VPCENFEIDTLNLLIGEYNVKTKYLYTKKAFKNSVDYIVNKKIDTKPFISKVFPMKEIEAAFIYKETTPSIKVVLENVR